MDGWPRLPLSAVIPPLHRHRGTEAARSTRQPDQEHLPPARLQHRAPIDARWSATAANGQPIIATADQTIQAGDGGTGLSLELQAFKRIPWRSEVYFTGTYLFNPRNTNGVSTFRTARGETVMSVTDQYLYRGGVGRPVPKIRGLAVSFGGRMEGVPVRDAIGGSDGFRRPGYAISIDPGMLYIRGPYTFSCNIPVAVERNRKRSVADYQNGRHGDAAFADYTLMFSLSRRFWPSMGKKRLTGNVGHKPGK